MTENWKSRMKQAKVAVHVSDVNAEMPRPTVEQIFHPTNRRKLFTITQWKGGPPTITTRPLNGLMGESFHRVIVKLDELLPGMNVYYRPDDLEDLDEPNRRTKHVVLFLSNPLNVEVSNADLNLAGYYLLDTTIPNPLLYRENGVWMTNDYYDPSYPRRGHQYFVHLLTYPDVEWESPKFDIVQKTTEWTE